MLTPSPIRSPSLSSTTSPTAAQAIGYVPPVVADAPPAVTALLRDDIVWDPFMDVARLRPLPRRISLSWVKLVNLTITI
jgi:hypothetical protein